MTGEDVARRFAGAVDRATERREGVVSRALSLLWPLLTSLLLSALIRSAEDDLGVLAGVVSSPRLFLSVVVWALPLAACAYLVLALTVEGGAFAFAAAVALLSSGLGYGLGSTAASAAEFAWSIAGSALLFALTLSLAALPGGVLARSRRARGRMTAAGAAAALLLVPSMAWAAQESTQAPLASGVHEQVLQPGNRRYTIVIPKHYERLRPVPLVLALHFGGRVTPYYGRSFVEAVVYPGLYSLGAIIVAPDCTGSDWTGPRSEEDVLDLLDHLHGRFDIDPARVLVTGYSMGGTGAWHFASRHQDRVTAALIMAGHPVAKAMKADWRIPLYVIHSRADEIVPFQPTEKAVSRLRQRGARVEFVVLDGVTHYESPRFVPALQAAVPWITEAWLTARTQPATP